MKLNIPTYKSTYTVKYYPMYESSIIEQHDISTISRLMQCYPMLVLHAGHWFKLIEVVPNALVVEDVQ